MDLSDQIMSFYMDLTQYLNWVGTYEVCEVQC